MINNIESKKIKYLHISKDDLILSLDRLTRFKHPEIKYNRVFSDILCKYLLEPKLNKKQIADLSTDTLKNIICEIWNNSAKIYGKKLNSNTKLLKVLRNEIAQTYIINEETQSLINIDLDYSPLFNIKIDYENLPINLKWLIKNRNTKLSEQNLRKKYKLRFPIEKIVLCEGITEEILLPEFANLYGYNFDENGVRLISAGGKNQVEKLYCRLKDELKIPVFILLDADAKMTEENIRNVLRTKDTIYLIKHGEIEDIFSVNLIKRTLNKRFKNICECAKSEFKHKMPMTKILKEFFRLHNLGDFQKADFAKELALNLKYKTDLTPEITDIIDIIKGII